MERFYAEISESRERDSPFSTANGRNHLSATIYELLLAGTDTTKTFLEWVIAIIVCYPDIQVRRTYCHFLLLGVICLLF